MKYTLKDSIVNGAPVKIQEGTHIQFSVTVVTKIVGAPENKFLQTDTILVDFPLTDTATAIDEGIITAAENFITENYV